MGEAYSPDTLRGLLVPFSWATISATDTDLTEDAARPGLPEASTATAMVLQSSGEQTSGTRRVQVQRGGFADGETASVVWDEGSGTWRGWDTPATISGFDSIDFPGTASLEYRNPHAVALDSGVVLVASSSTVGAATNVRIHTRTTAGAWSTASIHTEAPDGAHEPHPVLLVLPSGRVLCIFATYDVAGSLAQLKVLASEDDGATWETAQPFAMVDAIDTSTLTINRIRASYSEPLAQIALVMELSGLGVRTGLRWYASNDDGNTFSIVDTQSGAASGLLSDSGARHDVIAAPEGFLLSYSWDEPGFEDITVVYIVGSAFQSPWDAGLTWDGRLDSGGSGALPFTQSTTLAIEYTLVADPAGPLYVFALARPDPGATPEGLAAVSFDGGRTWEQIGRNQAGTNDARWFWPAATGTAHPQRFHACWHRGRVLLAHNADDAYTATVDPDALWAMYLGGYSTVSLPSIDQFVANTNSVPWFWQWHPYELPTAVGATAVGTATSEVLDSEFTIATASATARYYRGSLTTGMSIADGMMAEVELSTTDTPEIGLRITISDNTEGYEADLRLTSTTVELYDETGGPTKIGSTHTVASGDRVTLRLAVAAGKVFAAFKVNASDEDRDWTIVANGTALTDIGAGAGVAYFTEVGRTRTVGGTSTFKWYSGRLAKEGAAGLAGGFTTPDDLRGRPVSTQWMYLDDGMSIRATGGPAARGDTFSIVTEHDYPIEHQDVLQYPSPSQPWRGATVSPWVAAAKTLSYDLDDFGGMFQASGLWGWILMGCNVPVVRVEYRESAVWTTIATVDRTTSFAFERSGAFVVPAKTGADVAGHYVERGELAGGWWYDGTSEMRKIASNTGGYLTSGATHEQSRCRIRLEGADDTEAASGTGWVLPPNSTILLHDAIGRNNADAIRIVYDPSAAMPEPPEGQMVAGVSSPGEVVVWGTDSGATRRRQVRPNTELTERRDGRRHAATYGPSRETRSISWTEGVDTQFTNRTGGDDWVLSTTTSGAYPVTDRRSVPMELSGLIRELNGSKSVVVDLPYIPSGTPDAVHLGLSRMGGAMLCRLTGDLPLETLLGDEVTDELIRVSIVAEEEV